MKSDQRVEEVLYIKRRGHYVEVGTAELVRTQVGSRDERREILVTISSKVLGSAQQVEVEVTERIADDSDRS